MSRPLRQWDYLAAAASRPQAAGAALEMLAPGAQGAALATHSSPTVASQLARARCRHWCSAWAARKVGAQVLLLPRAGPPAFGGALISGSQGGGAQPACRANSHPCSRAAAAGFPVLLRSPSQLLGCLTVLERCRSPPDQPLSRSVFGPPPPCPRPAIPRPDHARSPAPPPALQQPPPRRRRWRRPATAAVFWPAPLQEALRPSVPPA